MRGLYVMGENPIISDPDISHAEEWFHNLDFVAVQDLFLTETARYADVVLPGASFAEKTGTVREHRAAHSAHAQGDRSAGRCARRSRDPHRALEPASGCPRRSRARRKSWMRSRASRRRGAACRTRGSPAAGCSIRWRMRIIREPISCSRVTSPPRTARRRSSPVEFLPPAELPDAEFPFFMNTGRQMYHWHTGTMTRRAHGTRCARADADGRAESAGRDGARDRGWRSGAHHVAPRPRSRSRCASPIASRGKQIFIPMHYREAAANLLTNPALDPYAKIPEFKVCAVHIEPVTRNGRAVRRRHAEASARRRATVMSASSSPETTKWILGSTEKLRSSPVRPAGSDARARVRSRPRACRSR